MRYAGIVTKPSTDRSLACSGVDGRHPPRPLQRTASDSRANRDQIYNEGRRRTTLAGATIAGAPMPPDSAIAS